MVTSKKLSSKRIAKIKKFPITYDKDSPKLTAKQIARMKPAHPELRNVAPVKIPLSIRIDSDVLSWFKSQGKGYQTLINKALRDVMTQSKRH
jgi:uncharacterized protein (DUF4415 family)